MFQVEVIPEDGEEDEDEDEDSNQGMMAVEGSDGQQYVVLEVIQLQDGDGQEQALAVVTGDNMSSVHPLNHSQGEEDSDSGELITGHHITPDRKCFL